MSEKKHDDERCANCGACKHCGAPRVQYVPYPMPYPVYPPPQPLPLGWRPYPQPYPYTVWSSSGAASASPQMTGGSTFTLASAS